MKTLISSRISSRVRSGIALSTVAMLLLAGTAFADTASSTSGTGSANNCFGGLIDLSSFLPGMPNPCADSNANSSIQSDLNAFATLTATTSSGSSCNSCGGGSNPFAGSLSIPINIDVGSTTVTGVIDPITGLNITVGTEAGNFDLASSNCQLKVVKIVNGGTAVSSDFQIHVLKNGVDIAHSPQAGSSLGIIFGSLKAATYTVTESGGPSGYSAAFSGDCDSQGSIFFSPNQSKSCTITNTFRIATSSTTTPPVVIGGGGTPTSTPTTTPPTTGGGGPPTPTSTPTTTPPTTGGGGPPSTLVDHSSGNGPPVTQGGGNGPPVTSGGNGPIVAATPGTPTPAGQVLGASTAAPGIPNTGDGGNAMTYELTLIASFLLAVAGAITLSRLNTRRDP